MGESTGAKVLAGFGLGLLTACAFYDGMPKAWGMSNEAAAAWAQAILSAGAIVFSVLLWRLDKRASVVASQEAARIADLRLTMRTASQLSSVLVEVPRAIQHARALRAGAVGLPPADLKHLLRIDTIWRLEQEIGEAPGCSLPMAMYALGCATWSKQLRGILDSLFAADKDGLIGSEVPGWLAAEEALKMVLKCAKALEQVQSGMQRTAAP